MDLGLTANNGTITETIWNFKGQVDYVDDWFLMKTPFKLLCITSLYLVFVLKAGPALMKNRSPFRATNILTLYNATQVLYSIYLCYIGTSIIWLNGLLCPSCLMETKESRYLITTSIYAYLFAKVTELIDTIFFVIRKKYNQITFLHVYHHSIMVWSTWFTLKYEPSYSIIFLGTLNSYVHVIMYAYYGLSTFPDLDRYLWWKKYITRMQMVQFVMILVHAVANLVLSGCSPSNTLMIMIVVNVFLFLYLFGSFYINSYVKARGKPKKCNNNSISEYDEKTVKIK